MSGGQVGTPDGVMEVHPPWWYAPIKACQLTEGAAPPWVFAGDEIADPQEWTDYIIMVATVEAEVAETKKPPQTAIQGRPGRSPSASPGRSTTFHINRGQGPTMITEG